MPPVAVVIVQLVVFCHVVGGCHVGVPRIPHLSVNGSELISQKMIINMRFERVRK